MGQPALEKLQLVSGSELLSRCGWGRLGSLLAVGRAGTAHLCSCLMGKTEYTPPWASRLSCPSSVLFPYPSRGRQEKNGPDGDCSLQHPNN